MKNWFYLIGMLGVVAGCSPSIEIIEGVVTDSSKAWQAYQTEKAPSIITDTIKINTSDTAQKVDGFGVCFTEADWKTICGLQPQTQTKLLNEVFANEQGAGFRVNHITMGAANVNGTNISYDEVEGDFDMRYFSIDTDRVSILPYIHAAQAVNPQMHLWASPVVPPAWMTINKKHETTSDRVVTKNGLIQDSLYLEAYALYFGKFIDSYQAENISVSMVMPQNGQDVTPCCDWNVGGLTRFIRNHLGKQMNERGTAIYLGMLPDTVNLTYQDVMSDTQAKDYIKGVGFNEGRNGIKGVGRAGYPNLPLYRWDNLQLADNPTASDEWKRMKRCFIQGTSACIYASLFGTDRSVPLIKADKKNDSFVLTTRYYLAKHISKYLKRDALFLHPQSENDEVLSFLNTDGTKVIMMANLTEKDKWTILSVDDNRHPVKLKSQSYSTFVCK